MNDFEKIMKILELMNFDSEKEVGEDIVYTCSPSKKSCPPEFDARVQLRFGEKGQLAEIVKGSKTIKVQ